MTLRKSILLSIALHVLLLGTGLLFARFAGSLLHRGSEPIMVALIGSDRSTAGGNEEKTTASHSARSKNVEALKRSVPEEVPVPQNKPTSASAPIEAPVQQAIGRQPGEGTNSEQPAPQQAAGQGGESAGIRPAASGSESGSVSSEQWAVIVTSIERVKTYPRLARERGIEGVVHLRFRVKPEGDVDRVEVVRSSGSDILDTASIHTLYRAGPMPFVNGWVEVPIAYILK